MAQKKVRPLSDSQFVSCVVSIYLFEPLFTFFLPRTVIGCYKHKNFVRGDRKLAIAINPQRGHTYAANQREQSKRHFDGGSLVIKVAKVIEQDSMVKKERYTQQVGNDTVSKKDLLIQYESPPPERPKQKKHKKSVLKQDREGSSENSGDFVPMMQNALCSMPIINQYSDAAPTAGEGGGPAAVPAAELLPSQDFYYTRHGLVLREQQYNRLVPPAAPPDGLSLPSASTTQKQQQQQQQQQQLFNNLEEETAEIVLRQMLWATIGKQQVVGDKGSIQKSINTNTQQKEVDSSCYPQQHAAAPPAPRQGVPPASAAPAAFGEQPTMKQEQVIEDRGRSSSSGWPKPVPLDLLPILDFRVSTYRVQGEGEVVVVGTDSSTVAAVRPPLPVQNESDTTSNEEDGDDESSLSWNLEQTSTILVQPTITRGDEEEQFEQHHTDLLLSCFEDMQEAPRP